jgi:hypothetical protein
MKRSILRSNLLRRRLEEASARYVQFLAANPAERANGGQSGRPRISPASPSGDDVDEAASRGCMSVSARFDSRQPDGADRRRAIGAGRIELASTRDAIRPGPQSKQLEHHGHTKKTKAGREDRASAWMASAAWLRSVSGRSNDPRASFEGKMKSRQQPSHSKERYYTANIRRTNQRVDGNDSEENGEEKRSDRSEFVKTPQEHQDHHQESTEQPDTGEHVNCYRRSQSGFSLPPEQNAVDQ